MERGHCYSIFKLLADVVTELTQRLCKKGEKCGRDTLYYMHCCILRLFCFQNDIILYNVIWTLLLVHGIGVLITPRNRIFK